MSLTYTPTHASWLNMMEIFFSILTYQIVVEIVEETFDVQIDHPGVCPAPRTADRHRVQR